MNSLRHSFPAGGFGSGFYFVRATKFLAVVGVLWFVIEVVIGVVQALNAITLP